MAQLNIGGYTRVPNVLIERVICKGLLTQYELQVVFAVLRLSLGWNHGWCYSSYGELAEMTGIAKRKVYTVCKALHARRILVVGAASLKTRFEVNLDISSWVLPRERNERNEVLPLQATPAVASTGNASPEDEAEIRKLRAEFWLTQFGLKT